MLLISTDSRHFRIKLNLKINVDANFLVIVNMQFKSKVQLSRKIPVFLKIDYRRERRQLWELVPYNLA